MSIHRNDHVPEEATQLICPISMASSAAQFEKCRGPHCMAWRWQPELTVDRPLQGAQPTGTGQKISAHRGYCGLAERP
jgi:hypothetical protein